MSERDTHFSGFSKIVWNEIGPMVNDSGLGENAKQLIAERIQRILAQRAYDLVYHSVDETGVAGYEGLHTVAEIVKDIPDLTEWPVEEQELDGH